MPAAFGLLGVIVGGVITAVSSYLLDERRSEREREREERDRSIEIKRAARMIDEGFSTAHALATVAFKNNYYWDSTSAPLTLKGWDDYGAILVPAVSSDAWLKIRLGIDAVRNLNAYREFDVASAIGEPVFPPVSNALKQAVARAADDILDAREALAPLCYESRGAASGS